MKTRSAPPNRSLGKTNDDARLAQSLRARSRTAFLTLLVGFQEADRQAQGALSQGRERSIYPGLVSAILRIVVVLFAEAREVSVNGAKLDALHALHRQLVPHRQGVLFDTHDAWMRVLATWHQFRQGLPRSDRIGADALFHPASTAFLEIHLPDALVWRVLDALLQADGVHLDFARLDLEHLGTFYEGLMAFDSLDARIHYDLAAAFDMRDAPSDDRKRLGAHYTSRNITQTAIDRALEPLLATADSSRALLARRICDPAMGSGAFLLETCRHLADVLLRFGEPSGTWSNVCLGEDEVVGAQRLVARQCIYGVDKNPRAAELARWALWLLTSSRKSPGVLLDEHIRAGDSLIGRPGGDHWFSGELPRKYQKYAESWSRHRPFHWDVEFPAVMDNAGFDAFVGNPPWVSYAGRAAQPLDDDLRAYFSDTNPAFAGYKNLQGLFISRCAAMLRPGGRLGFVLPSSMSELEGYLPTRRAHECFCECDDDLPDLGDVFDDVFQPSMALLSTRRDKPISVEHPRVWPLHRSDLDPDGLALLARLSAFPTFPPELFGERGFQSMGEDIQHLHALDAPAGAFRTGVRVGGDIEPFLRRSPKFYCDPAAFGGRFRAAEEWALVALLIRQTARFPMVALADGQAFRNSILAGFASETWSRFFLLAWLNSSPIRWFHYVRNRDARQGMPQVKIAHLRALPAPRSNAYVQRIETLGRTFGQRNAGVSSDEQQCLDDLVTDALELSSVERQIIQHWRSALLEK